MKHVRRVMAALLGIVLLTASAFAVADAPMNGYISDTANAISSETETYINEKVDGFNPRHADEG